MLNCIFSFAGLAISNKHTYMFSAGDDKQVKCWDLEQNKVGECWIRALYNGHTCVVPIVELEMVFQVIRSYHGHLSGVYCLAIHPTIDILLTGGRDSVCRVRIHYYA